MPDSSSDREPESSNLVLTPERVAFAVLAVLGMLFGLYTGVPWMTKSDGLSVRNEMLAKHTTIDRDLARLDHADELTREELRSLWTAWNDSRAEIERLKAYVYPMPSGVSTPRRTPSH